MGDLTLVEPRDLIVAELSFIMTILLEYFFGECTIRMTVLLEYLNRVLSMCGCHLFYNSLVFNPILLSFGRGFLLSLFHLHSNF